MKLVNPQLDHAFERVITGLEKQNLPAHLKKRWQRALEKAQRCLVKQPFFALHPDRLLIVSGPKKNSGEIGCRFYETNAQACHRVDKSGLCEAFFEGFPCWHRAAFLLLKIYFGETSNDQGGRKSRTHLSCQKVSTEVDTSG